MLDACRNNPVSTVCPAFKAAAGSFRDFKFPEVGRIVLVSSTKPGQVALDGLAGAHSPFAQALFESLQVAPSVYFHQVFDQVAKAVIAETEQSGFTQIPEVLIRGGAPEDCLSGKACTVDPRADALAAELNVLKAARARDQELTQIAQGYLQAVGVRAIDRPLSDDEKARALEGLKDAGRALAVQSNAKSEEALQKLKSGDSSAAEALFAEALADQDTEL